MISTSILMTFPPTHIGKAGIILCGLRECPLNVAKRVGEGTGEGDPMAFQLDIDITHVEAPSSITVQKILVFW